MSNQLSYYTQYIVEKRFSSRDSYICKVKFTQYTDSCSENPEYAILKTKKYESCNQDFYEADVMKKCCRNNPGLIKYYFHYNSDKLYLFMECCWSKGSLSHYIANQKNNISERILLENFENLYFGLKHLHSENIVHCDISLKNIAFSDNQELKIIDFGCATQIGKRIHGFRKFYLPPHVLKKISSAVATPSNDFWALGKCLYECCTLQEFVDFTKFSQEDINKRIKNDLDYHQYTPMVINFIYTLMNDTEMHSPDLKSKQNNTDKLLTNSTQTYCISTLCAICSLAQNESNNEGFKHCKNCLLSYHEHCLNPVYMFNCENCSYPWGL